MSVVGSNLVCQVGVYCKGYLRYKKEMGRVFRSRRAGSKSLRRI